jgi:hypothetical protein
MKFAPDTSGCKPHAWNKMLALNAMRFVERLVPEGLGADPRVIVEDGRGPSYTPPVDGNDVGIISAPPKTHPTSFVHEVGHHLEHTVPGAKDLCNSFLKHRTAGDEPVDLVAAGLTQVAGATGYRDQFARALGDKRAPYAGRRYASHGGTEILSMGLEALHDDPIGFAKTDPEWFAFIMLVISGDFSRKGASHAG